MLLFGITPIPFSVSLFLHAQRYRNFNEAIHAATGAIVGRLNERNPYGRLHIDLGVFKATAKQEAGGKYITPLLAKNSIISDCRQRKIERGIGLRAGAFATLNITPVLRYQRLSNEQVKRDYTSEAYVSYD